MTHLKWAVLSINDGRVTHAVWLVASHKFFYDFYYQLVLSEEERGTQKDAFAYLDSFVIFCSMIVAVVINERHFFLPLSFGYQPIDLKRPMSAATLNFEGNMNVIHKFWTVINCYSRTTRLLTVALKALEEFR